MPPTESSDANGMAGQETCASQAPAQPGVRASALASGYAAAADPVQAQTLLHTDSAGLIAGEVQIPVGPQAIPAYRALPEGRTAAPIVLVVQEIFGVHEHIKDVCRRLAKLGYLALAPELYARQGDASRFDDIPTLYREIVAKVPDAQVMGDLDACAAWAASHGGDPDRMGITGFCWGGRITWLYAAHNAGLKAAVAWYGRLIGDASAFTPRYPLDVAANLHAPMLGLYGGADSSIPLESVERMKQALAVPTGTSAPARSRIIVYPDAPHAFFADYRPGYRKTAAEDGWQRCLQWLQSNGVA